LKNGCNNLCHMLTFVKVKIFIFKHFSDVLFELFLSSLAPKPLEIEALQGWTRDMYHTPRTKIAQYPIFNGTLRLIMHLLTSMFLFINFYLWFLCNSD